MTENIRQEFTIDPSQAVAAIRLLDASFDRFAGRLDRVGGTMNRTSADSKRLTTSLQLLSRITFTQAAVRGLSFLRREMSEGVEQALDFERVVRQTLAISPGQTFDNLAGTFRRFSDETGVSLEQVSTAGRELASSGFADLQDQLKIMNSAWKLQAVGVSDFTEANQLLIGSLNALGKGADFADTFSAKFFRTVDIGNITVEQLAHNFGRIAPLVRSTGADFEEALALFSSLTIKGVNPNEASTQISALFNAFIKPSKGMQEALKQLGKSGSELIQERGIVGAMQAVAATTDGTAESFGKIFINVRGLRGLLSATSDQFQTLNKHLMEIRDTSEQAFNTKSQEFFNSRLQKLTKSWNELKNVGIDVGNAFADAFLAGVQAINEIDAKAQSLGITLPKITAALREMVATPVDLLTGKGFSGIAERAIADVDARARTQTGKVFQDTAPQDRIRLLRAQIEALKDLDFGGIAPGDELVAPLQRATDLLEQLQATARPTAEQGRQVALAFAQVGAEVEKVGRFEFAPGFLAQFSNIQEFVGLQLKESLTQTEQAAQGTATEAKGLSTATQSATSAADANLAAWKETLLTIKASREEAAKIGTSTPQSKRFGGMLYRAGGGFSPRGTDTVPAMLSPGEFVMNASASRRWYAELVSMNAGRQPVYRAEGGPVSNTSISVGDVNINGSAKMTPRDVARALEREIRRGTIRR